MFTYVGIDEAGYGPRFGPLVVARATLVIPNLPPFPDHDPPHLWQRLSKAVGRTLQGHRGRLVVADSKKLKTKAAGLRHLELGCLAFAALSEQHPADVADWLDALGCDHHRNGQCPPWYAPAPGSSRGSADAHAGDSDPHPDPLPHPDAPWDPLPGSVTPGELAIARNLLASTCRRIGVHCPGLAAGVVFEPDFNHRLKETHSKAAVSFEHVARHLHHAWRTHGPHRPLVVVDRQGGRTDYRELLAMTVPDASIAVLEQTPERSRYELAAGDRAMHISFETEAEDRHMPVALASMTAKYTRELLMTRLNRYFTARVDGLQPSAGYGTDGNRFLNDLHPHLPRLGLQLHHLRRDA